MYSQVYNWCLWTAALVAFVWPWLQQSPSSLPSPCQVLENTHAVTSHYPTAPTVWTEQCVLLQAHTSGVCLALITLVSFLSSMSAIAAVESTHTYTHTHTHTHKSTTLLPPPPYTQSNNNITTESHKNHTLLTACCATLLLREQYERERFPQLYEMNNGCHPTTFCQNSTNATYHALHHACNTTTICLHSFFVSLVSSFFLSSSGVDSVSPFRNLLRSEAERDRPVLLLRLDVLMSDVERALRWLRGT